MKLTKTFIDKLELSESGKVSFYWDSEVRGYGIKVSETKKVYIVQTKIKGSTVRLTIGTHGVITEAQAREFAKRELFKIADGIDPRLEKKKQKILEVTLSDVTESFIKTRTLKPSTISDIQRHLRTTFSEWNDRPISKITRKNVLEHFKKISEGAPAQANQAFRILRSLLNFARATFRDGDDMPLLPENPVTVLSDAKIWNHIKPKSRKIPLNKVGEVWIDIQSMRYMSKTYNIDTTHFDFISFLLLTGCRKSEAAELTWDRVNLKEQWWYLPDPKNKHSVTFPLPSEACRFLSLRSRLSHFVFPANTKTGHIEDARRLFKYISNISGCTITAHDLRRTFKSIASECGIELWRCKLLMNHQDSDVTITSYTETSDLKYLLPEVEKICTWIIGEGEKKIAQDESKRSILFNIVASKPQEDRGGAMINK